MFFKTGLDSWLRNDAQNEIEDSINSANNLLAQT